MAGGNKPWSKNGDSADGGLTKFSLDGGNPQSPQEKNPVCVYYLLLIKYVILSEHNTGNNLKVLSVHVKTKYYMHRGNLSCICACAHGLIRTLFHGVCELDLHGCIEIHHVFVIFHLFF